MRQQQNPRQTAKTLVCISQLISKMKIYVRQRPIQTFINAFQILLCMGELAFTILCVDTLRPGFCVLTMLFLLFHLCTLMVNYTL
jgi:hypothetical protein